jgi:hypothetical protein
MALPEPFPGRRALSSARLYSCAILQSARSGAERPVSPLIPVSLPPDELLSSLMDQTACRTYQDHIKNDRL